MTTAAPSAAEKLAKALQISDLRFAYPDSQVDGKAVIQIPHWQVDGGQTVFMQGPSGSGKSTLLGLLGGILAPDQGTLEVLGQNLSDMGTGARDRFRAQNVGFIFQMFNLLPYLSVLENVTLPARFSASRAQSGRGQSPIEQATALLARLGIGDQLYRRPVTQLSVGQQQRVAAARALMGCPGLLIADEPTSALDADNRQQFIEVLLAEARAAGSTVLFVSHDPALAGYFDQAVNLADINQADGAGSTGQ